MSLYYIYYNQQINKLLLKDLIFDIKKKKINNKEILKKKKKKIKYNY